MSNQKSARHCEHVITPNCSIDCLQDVLSGGALNPLARADGAPFDPPRKVSDVIELYRQERLLQIAGLGRRRIGEIEAALVFAGLILDPHPATAPTE